MTNWAVGAAINVIGGITINLGANLLRLGHTKAASHDREDCVPGKGLWGKYCAWQQKPGQRIWLLGLTLFLLGNVLNFASFAFAAQSLLAALAVVQLIANVVFARIINKERASRAVILATGLVSGGCILLVAFGSHDATLLTAQDLLDLYHSAPYIVYLSVLVPLALMAVAFYKLRCHRSPAPRWLPLAFALYAAGLGTQSMVYGKSLAMLLRATLQGDSQLMDWYTWVALGLFAGFATFWVVQYSEAMRRFPVTIMLPTLMILWVLFSMLSGMVYFQEYKTFTPLSTGMFVLGCCILGTGIFIFATAQPQQQECQSSSGTAQEDDIKLDQMGDNYEPDGDIDAISKSDQITSCSDLGQVAPHPKSTKPSPLLLVQNNPIASWEDTVPVRTGSLDLETGVSTSPSFADIPKGFVNPMFGEGRQTPMSCRPMLWRSAETGSTGPPPGTRGFRPPMLVVPESGTGLIGSSIRSASSLHVPSSSPSSSILTPIVSIFSMPGTLGSTTTPKAMLRRFQ